MSVAVGNMWLIEASNAATVAQVKEQERLYESLRQALTAKYGRLGNLVCARSFGVDVDVSVWKTLADYATGRLLSAPPQFEAWLRQADALSERPTHRFFHWDLEFPEVFFDQQGRPLGDAAGFDVVVGNPPYVEQERLKAFKPFFEAGFPEVFHGVADLYLYFYAQAIRQLRRGGYMGFISSGTFARANFASGFRKTLPALAQVESLIDFGENQPFEGAEMVRPSIVVLRRGQHTGSFRSLFLSGKVPASLEEAVAEQGIECDADVLAQPEWTFQAAEYTRLFEKIKKAGRPLGEVVNGRLYYGVKTGLNEAFLIDTPTRDRLVAEDPPSAALLKPMLRGEDLRPWYQEDEGRWLVALPCGWTAATFGKGLTEPEAWDKFRERYPGLADHLSPFADPARKRWDKGEFWWELRPCDYYEAFDKPKIFWPDISKLPRFSFDDTSKYCNDKGSIVAVDDHALLGVLQSRVVWLAVSQIALQLRLRAGLWQYQMKSQFVERLPIPEMNGGAREAIGRLAREITAHARERYALHEKARKRLRDDLGTPTAPLNQKLTAWWDLPDLKTLRAEIGKVYKSDIPVKDRDDWDDWLAARRAEHARLTDAIIARETELNDRVYRLFGLTQDEIKRVEESTKYRYGEV